MYYEKKMCYTHLLTVAMDIRKYSPSEAFQKRCNTETLTGQHTKRGLGLAFYLLACRPLP